MYKIVEAETCKLELHALGCIYDEAIGVPHLAQNQKAEMAVNPLEEENLLKVLSKICKSRA